MVNVNLFVLFSAILADLTGIFVQRRFDNLFVDVLSFQMRSAAQSLSNDTQPAYNVEQCECDVSRNVEGTPRTRRVQSDTNIDVENAIALRLIL